MPKSRFDAEDEGVDVIIDCKRGGGGCCGKGKKSAATGKLNILNVRITKMEAWRHHNDFNSDPIVTQ